MLRLTTIILIIFAAIACADKPSSSSSDQLVSSKAVFGEDNREDVYQSLNPQHKEWARSTAAMVDNNLLRQVAQGQKLPSLYEHGVTVFLEDAMFPMKGQICPEMRYANQPVAANCSGFLVGPDLLVTAGHCMTRQSMCDSYSWVFDYQVDPEKGIAATEKDVYGCAEIIEQNFTIAEAIFDENELAEYKECTENALDFYHRVEDECGEYPKPISWNYSQEVDYALIRLDRPVQGRTPLKFRTSVKIELDTELVVIGNPLGLPTKITTSGRVLDNEYPHSFGANLDAFKGNSGSAVFNAETGVVEGILVRGWMPFSFDAERKCYQISPFDEDGLSYDDEIDRKDLLTGVNRITSILSLPLL